MSMVAMARPAPLTMQPIVAVQRDVGQVMFGRFDFLGVLLGLVAQREDIRMAIERVGVERHLGVEAFQLALGGDDQRIDLQHGHVLLDEGLVELGDQNARPAWRDRPSSPSACATVRP